MTFIPVKAEEFGFSIPITPENIKDAIDAKKSGLLREIDNLFDNLIDGDDNLAADIDTRMEALKSKRPSLSNNLSPKQTDFFNEILKKLYPDLVNFVIEAKLKGYNFAQIRYELKNNLFYPVEIITYQNIDLRINNKQLELSPCPSRVGMT